MEEQVAVLRALWASDLVDIDGEFHRIDRAGLLPRPVRPIPIWFGGSKDRIAASRRAPRRWLRLRSQRTERRRALTTLRIPSWPSRDAIRRSFGSETMVDYALGADIWHEHTEAFGRPPAARSCRCGR